MSYTLLAHLYPRIKGSQEDIATYSLSYILEQSSVLNDVFTKLIRDKLKIHLSSMLSYHCQDSDSEYGRPDITGYDNSELSILCEAKFYAGLTQNQPSSYIRRLLQERNSDQGGYPQFGFNKGLIFICPKARITSLWDKLKECAREDGFEGKPVDGFCMDYSGVRMSIISWDEILTELIHVATDRSVEMLGDLEQLRGFCEKIEQEAFVPFRPEDFGVQVARDIDRYYQVVDEVYDRLRSHKELNPSSKGLRKSPRWEGYSQYLKLGKIALSVDYIRRLWKAPTSVETPFWCHFKEVNDQGHWVYSDKIKNFMSTIDSKYQDEFSKEQYVALIPKPYMSLEEVADDLCVQIISMYYKIVSNGNHPEKENK